MILEFGFQPGHSEDMVLIADFTTEAEAEKAVVELARFIVDIHTSIEASHDMSGTKGIGDEGAKEYLQEAKKRWTKLCGNNELEEGLDWSVDEAYIGSSGNRLKFMVNTAGYALDEIAKFLMKQGAISVDDGDDIPINLVPHIIENFQEQSGLAKIIEKGLQAVEKKNARKARSKRP